MTADERKAMEKTMLAECKTKEGATDDDVASVLARDIPTTPTAKCVHACLIETVGLVKDGKASIEGAIELAKMAYDGDEKAMQMAKDISSECVHIEDSNRCELATKMLVCAREAVTKRGINPKDML